MASFLCIQNQPRDDGSRCVGSSHSWLILFQQQINNLYLFNPSTRARVQLPPWPFSLVHKAVLSANPATTNDYVVVVIYGLESRTAYFNMGRELGSLVPQEWRGLDHQKYVSDVMCRNGLIYALYYACEINVWDVRSTHFARKINDVKPSLNRDDFGVWESMRALCSRRSYVVESGGEVFLVYRLVGDYVRDGEPISDEDLLDSETNHPLVCPYRTLGFQLYRLDSVRNEWVEVNSIGANRVMFVGRNQSACVSSSHVPGCEGNSIYFTDDDWLRMDEDYTYGGHDMGVYSLDDKSLKDLFQSDVLERIEPLPVWLLPPGAY